MLEAGASAMAAPVCSTFVFMFGRALAACRTKRLKKHQKLARRFMREAKQSETSMDERPRVNDAWVRGANLRPILAYLSKCK
ncbi:unnamed protein product [Durusdinium trenchii]|uniref:Secreted protein n=1 Tax=Durusdinium trenchii TaxID=1381693 RepID=A0ABP0RSD7_9DINO